MGKISRTWNKVFLLGMFGMVFAFGIPVSLVFADEIPRYIDGEIIDYEYRLANGLPDWDTFYKVLNQYVSQYANQYRYYGIEISAYKSNGVSRLFRFISPRFVFYNNSGSGVTMWFSNQSKSERAQILRSLGMYDGAKLIDAEREFTDIGEALRFWRNAVEIIR